MCRSRRELSNEYLLAKVGVDTAENEPVEVWGENSIQYSLHSLKHLLDVLYLLLVLTRELVNSLKVVSGLGDKHEGVDHLLQLALAHLAERCLLARSTPRADGLGGRYLLS